MTDTAIEQDVVVPDIGDIPEVEVIEVLVSPGNEVQANDPLITLESDKATMDVPSPSAGTVKQLKISIGDRVREGSTILTLAVTKSDTAIESPESGSSPECDATTEAVKHPPQKSVIEPVETENLSRPDESTGAESILPVKAGSKPHASPSVRRFARELGADLSSIKGTGIKGRILLGDVQSHVKSSMQRAEQPILGAVALSAVPPIDYSQFGEIETQPLSKIKKLSGAHLHRSWVTVPHVTQHDEADITDLEAFRQSLKTETEQQQPKVTLLPFIMKAAVSALKSFPRFNASLDAGGDQLVIKKYYHLGVAVDTADGLIVPVIRDVDQKGIKDLAIELETTSDRARGKKLSPKDLQGGSFTISSLGGIAGTSFTPIVNAPEVAILGVSRAKTQPVYQQGEFVPRLILPLSLSYDHRVIDGAEAARFTAYLTNVLSDLRRLLL